MINIVTIENIVKMNEGMALKQLDVISQHFRISCKNRREFIDFWATSGTMRHIGGEFVKEAGQKVLVEEIGRLAVLLRQAEANGLSQYSDKELIEELERRLKNK